MERRDRRIFYCGTYRLRTVFKVYSGVSYETFEKTSSEVIV